MKVLIFDIESTNLAANFGYIICISYKWLGHPKVHTIRIDQFKRFKKDPTNDIEVVKAFEKVFNEADRVVAHYGKKFDKTFVNTRRLVHNLSVLPNTKLIDTWRIAKDHLRLNSNRLETIISALGIKTQKTKLSGPIWIKAMAGDKQAINYVVTHCIADVKALEEVFIKLRPFISDMEHPSLHKCDSKYMHSNGYRVADKQKYRRLFCLNCKGWFKGEVIK